MHSSSPSKYNGKLKRLKTVSTRFPKSVSKRLQISQNPPVSTRLLTKIHWSLHSCPSENFKHCFFLPWQFLWAIMVRDGVSETELIVF